MGRILIGLGGLILGLVIGVLASGAVVGGAAGIGVATGLSGGICAVVTAAQDEGVLTEEEIGQVLRRAASNLSGDAALPDDLEVVGNAEECQQVMARLREAAAD